MSYNPLKIIPLTVLITTALLLTSAALAITEKRPVQTEENKISIPVQVDLIQRLEKAGLHPSVVQKVEPPKRFQMPEVPQTIQNEHLSPAGLIRMEQLERQRSAGKLTETEYTLEKDTLFRDANIKY